MTIPLLTTNCRNPKEAGVNMYTEWTTIKVYLCLAVAEFQTVAHAVPKPQLASLLIQCPDQKGVVAALAQLLYGFGCNILESDQYTDQTTGTYFQR